MKCIIFLRKTLEKGLIQLKNIKRLTAAILALVMLFAFASCGENPDTTEEVTDEVVTEIASSYIRETKTKIAAVDGAVGFGVTKFSVDRAYNYETEFLADVSEAVSRIKAGAADIATLPVSEAAKLFNETNGAIKIIAVTGLGFYSVLENGEKIQSVRDLKGKTVYAAYKGTAFEQAINYVFAQNGIDPEKDIKLEFKATDKEVAELTTGGEAAICILSEPYASKVLHNEETYRKALSFNDEWDKISETPLAQSVLVARTAYIDSNPDIIKEFIGFCKISVNYLINDTYGAPVFLKENNFCEAATLATVLIPAVNLRFISGEDMKAAVGKVLSDVYEISVDDAFYFGV